MAVLADHVLIRERFANSINIERDSEQNKALEDYIVTARALDVIERIAHTAESSLSGGAWSITGPHGSGKSSLALLIDSLFGRASPTRELAFALVDQASDKVGKSIIEAHKRHKTWDSGFSRGLVTASKQPISHTVLRALHSAILRRYGKIPPVTRFRAAKLLREALRDMESKDPRRLGPSSTAIVEITQCLAEERPLLLIIDEFGKNLEAAAEIGTSDPYLLQQIAELGQGSGLPIFLLTIQHLPFQEYSNSSNDFGWQEWSKVQGRFEDIVYVASPNTVRSLIGKVFAIKNREFKNRVKDWAKPLVSSMESLGIHELASQDVVASCYPLHPLSTLVLPELCSRYGQQERTLFTFLTSSDSASASSFLSTTKISSKGDLPSIGLSTIYDFFVSRGTLTNLAAVRSSRWQEIAIRLRDVYGLSSRETAMAKTIALLNLISTSGNIRASSKVLALSESFSSEAVESLENKGIAIYRRFADEYRIWHGSDLDIHELIEVEKRKVFHEPLVNILNRLDKPSPVVAARHSAKLNLLRIFSRRYVTGNEEVEPLESESPFDGEVLLVVDNLQQLPKLRNYSEYSKPTVVAISKDLEGVDSSAREVLALNQLMENSEVQSDWVIRRELSERLAEAHSILEHNIDNAFGSDSCRWVLLRDNSTQIELSNRKGSTAISEASDQVYSSSPHIRNEMLNRNVLTSQGTKARKQLLKAMIENETEKNLGLSGYGPEVAMYHALLRDTGLHRTVSKSLRFTRPIQNSSLTSAWKVIVRKMERAKSHRINLLTITNELRLPPIGMKAGAIPVLMIATLIAYRDRIAIYEHGTFKPLFSTDLLERLVRNPAHFEIKHFANTRGGRLQVINELVDRLGINTTQTPYRVGNVLSVVIYLMTVVKNLERFTLTTHRLSSSTLKIRDCLVQAVEPDVLIFDRLPRAVGCEVIPVNSEKYEFTIEYAKKVGESLEELTFCFERMLRDLFDYLIEISGEVKQVSIVGQATALDGEILNPAIRAFVNALSNDTSDNNLNWINKIAMIVTEKSPEEWDDNDFVRFKQELPRQFAAFQRLVSLHAEQKVSGGVSFEALRVSITKSDGVEYLGMVDIEDSERENLDNALDEALQKLAECSFSSHRARRSLLALIGERLLQEEQSNNDEVTNIRDSSKEVQNG